MKCPFCHIMPTGARGNIVQFSCGMVMAVDAVQQRRPDEIEAYRLHQPAACIRGERDRYIRSQARLDASVAELEARCKRAENDAGWAFSMGAVVHRDEGDWYAVCEGECGSNPSLFSAISELRSHVEAKP